MIKLSTLEEAIATSENIRAEFKCPICDDIHYSGVGLRECVDSYEGESKKEVVEKAAVIISTVSKLLALGVMEDIPLDKMKRTLPPLKLPFEVRFVCEYCLPDKEFTDDAHTALEQIREAAKDVKGHRKIESHLIAFVRFTRGVYFAVHPLLLFFTWLLYNHTNNARVLIAAPVVLMVAQAIHLSVLINPHNSIIPMKLRIAAFSLFVGGCAAVYVIG